MAHPTGGDESFAPETTSPAPLPTPVPTPVAPGADPAGIRPTGFPGLSREWDGHAWAPRALTDPAAEAIRNHGHAMLRTRRFWFAALAVVVGAVLSGVAGAYGHSRDWLAGLAAAFAVGGALLGLSAAVWHRLRLRAAIVSAGWSVAAVVGLGLISGVVALVLAYTLETWFGTALGVGKIGSLFLAGPIEETSKLLVPVILFFALRRRLADPRTGFAVVWVSATLFGFAEGIEYLLGLGKAEHLVRPTADRAATEASIGVMLLLSRTFTELMHPLLTAGAAAAMWLGAWRGRALLAGGGLVAFLTAIALHSINDGAIGGLLQEVLPRATFIVWPLWVVLIYQVFRIHTRELVPPGAISSSPKRWRPRHPRTIDAPSAPRQAPVEQAPVQQASVADEHSAAEGPGR